MSRQGSMLGQTNALFLRKCYIPHNIQICEEQKFRFVENGTRNKKCIEKILFEATNALFLRKYCAPYNIEIRKA